MTSHGLHNLSAIPFTQPQNVENPTYLDRSLSSKQNAP